jgi:hypothetical protein
MDILEKIRAIIEHSHKIGEKRAIVKVKDLEELLEATTQTVDEGVFKEGEEVRVTGNSNSHLFEIGETVRLVEHHINEDKSH